MTKAKTLDRLELTRRKMAFRENMRNAKNVTPVPGVEDLPPEKEIHGNICPECGHHNLIHESGCVKCTYCSWSKCG